MPMTRIGLQLKWTRVAQQSCFIAQSTRLAALGHLHKWHGCTDIKSLGWNPATGWRHWETSFCSAPNYCFFQIKMPITQIWPWGTFASFTNSQLLNQMITAFVGLNGQLDQVMKQFWLPFDLVFKVGEITGTVIRLSVIRHIWFESNDWILK